MCKILNVTWAEICRDLERAVEFDQSQMFRKIYEDEFGTPGGEPYGVMIVDHDIRHRSGQTARTDDVSALAALASVAAASFCPTIVGAHPALLEVDDSPIWRPSPTSPVHCATPITHAGAT